MRAMGWCLVLVYEWWLRVRMNWEEWTMENVSTGANRMYRTQTVRGNLCTGRTSWFELVLFFPIVYSTTVGIQIVVAGTSVNKCLMLLIPDHTTEIANLPFFFFDNKKKDGGWYGFLWWLPHETVLCCLNSASSCCLLAFVDWWFWFLYCYRYHRHVCRCSCFSNHCFLLVWRSYSFP